MFLSLGKNFCYGNLSHVGNHIQRELFYWKSIIGTTIVAMERDNGMYCLQNVKTILGIYPME